MGEKDSISIMELYQAINDLKIESIQKLSDLQKTVAVINEKLAGLDQMKDELAEERKERREGDQRLHQKIECLEKDVYDELDKIKARPGKWWDKMLGGILIAAAGAVVYWIIDRLKGP